MKCLFCQIETEVDAKRQQGKIRYNCDRCGPVFITEEAEELIKSDEIDNEQILLMSMYLRSQFEIHLRQQKYNLINTEKIKEIVNTLRKFDAIEQMERALLNLNAMNKHVGDEIKINYKTDYPYYYCSNPQEMGGLFDLLNENNYIKQENRGQVITILSKGYQFIRELKERHTNFKQCFVAMWFIPEMNEIFTKVIRPAIEFKEEGEKEAKFKAVKADTEEYATDINDWIISEIRRSRFMVCDLTGYRGGVYFEAGFAYGLGLPVIYTCRKDWCESLKDENGKIIREGVHFDLNHQNRIEWEQNDLEGFQRRLTNRIKAIIL